jgi:pyruvate dehydrogenase E2 component (dihydrolipoamide acetyltransferase)
MVYEFKFADIGEGVHEGEILQWHVKIGDTIQTEDVLLEVHTEKVNTEITSPVSGKILSLEKKDGDIIKVGEVLVKIDTDVKEAKASKISEKKQAPKKDDSLFTPSQEFKRVIPKQVSDIKKKERVLASPAIREKARGAGIDLHNVSGTGPAGRITREDFETFLTANETKPSFTEAEKTYIAGEEEILPLRGTRRTIAQYMRRSKDMAAHYSYFDEVDMTALDELRNAAKPLADEKNIKITYLALIIKALIPALQAFPIMNSSLDDEKEEIKIKHYYNIGIAVDTPEGLIVPVIKNADQKNVWELASEIEILAEKARTGKLTLDDVSGGTFTITSVGNIGGMMATPIIRWPEVAILGIARAKLRPVVIEKDGKAEIGIRKILYLSLTLDHRIVDGATGARFTSLLIKYLENPSLLILD